MKKNQDVRFIRKNGRVIPIKVKSTSRVRRKFTPRERTQKAKDSAFKVAAGSLLASLGGSIFGTFSQAVKERRKSQTLLRKQIKARKMAAMQGSELNRKMAKSMSKVLNSKVKQTKRLEKFGRFGGNAGLALGGVVLGKAITDGFEAATGKDLTTTQEVFTEVGGVAAVGIGANRIGKARSKSFKQAARIASKLVFKR